MMKMLFPLLIRLCSDWPLFGPDYFSSFSHRRCFRKWGFLVLAAFQLIAAMHFNCIRAARLSCCILFPSLREYKKITSGPSCLVGVERGGWLFYTEKSRSRRTFLEGARERVSGYRGVWATALTSCHMCSRPLDALTHTHIYIYVARLFLCPDSGVQVRPIDGQEILPSRI